MAADHVVTFQLVTADGRFVTASDESNVDFSGRYKEEGVAPEEVGSERYVLRNYSYW